MCMTRVGSERRKLWKGNSPLAIYVELLMWSFVLGQFEGDQECSESISMHKDIVKLTLLWKIFDEA